jgi:hypothetical protein
LGLPKVQHQNALSRITAALTNTLKSDRGRWLLGPRDEGQSELPVTGMLDGKIAHRVIDRTFVADGIRWIVDFKTGLHSGDVNAFLDEEQRRYSVQLHDYAQLMAALDDRPIQVGLYFPLMDGWRTWAPGGAPHKPLAGRL